MGQDQKSTSLAFPTLRRPARESREDQVPAIWHVGDVILGLYEVKDVYWPGATGLVYRVHHREWDLDLAVKSPRETPFETEEQQQNFVEATDGWIGLGLFPHIVSCYYVRKLGGIPRLFLEFVEGESLHEWIQTRRLYETGPAQALKTILDIAIQYAWGLQHAHQHQEIHGDVRPANLLLTADATAKVKGFGLSENSATVSGEAGSAFSAPERTGRLGLSVQADIWSWAASVLEMFTGELRWREGELSDVALGNYLERGEHDGDIPRMPGEVAQLLQQCLAGDPTRRPSSMAEVAGELRKIYRGETGSDHPRQLPVAASLSADQLNNRALSLEEMGRIEEALWLWDEALALDPQHVEATYNNQLVRWRAGRVTDTAVIATLNGLRNSGADAGFVDYLLSRINLERDDTRAAAAALEKAGAAYADQSDVGGDLTSANRGPQSAPDLPTFLDDEICGPGLFSADGKSLLLTVSGFKILILDFDKPHSTRYVRPRYLQGHTAAINTITISADGRCALSSSEDGTIRLWDLVTAKCAQTIADTRWPHARPMALSADGNFAVLGFDRWSEEATLQWWDVRAGHRVRDFETTVSEYGEPQDIWAASISPDGKYLLSGGQYGTVQIWDVNTGKVVRDFKGLWGYVKFVSFNLDGSTCFAANDHELREFDIQSGACVEGLTIEEYSDRKTSLITVSADGNYALFGSSHGELKLWEVNTGRCVRTFQDLSGRPHHEVQRYEGISSIELSPDGKYSLSGTRGGTHKLWRFDPEYRAPLIFTRIKATEKAIKNQDVAEENLVKARQAIAENRFVDAANFIRTARSVPGYERSIEAVELWTSLYVHLPRTHLKASWLSHEVRGQRFAGSISFDADGKYVLFGGMDMELKEVVTDKRVRVFDAASGPAALSGDARLALVGGYEKHELWDTMSGKRIDQIWTFPEAHVKDICMSVDGKYAASCTDEKFSLWKITDEGPRYIFSTQTEWGELSAVAISSDNKYCVGGTGFSVLPGGVGSDYSLRLWALPSGEFIRTFTGYDSGTYAVVFSPDCQYFLGAGYDHKLRLWEIATGECVRLFEGHSQPVYSVDISSDGNYAVSGSTDQTLRLWETATGECVRTWEIKTDFIGPVRFTSDCKYLLIGTTGVVLRVELLDWELEDREP
jgi:WD40 repeat protein